MFEKQFMTVSHKSVLFSHIAVLVVSLCALNSYADTTEERYFPLTPQAAKGKVVYQQNCLECHGEDKRGGEFGPALSGAGFLKNWEGISVARLEEYISQNMPPASAGALSEDAYLQLLSYILDGTGTLGFKQEVPDNPLKRLGIRLPEASENLQEEIIVPPAPSPRPNPLADITPVSNAMLTDPSGRDWLMWRRTYDAKGFSPLKKINRKNVGKLQPVWSWSMPSGRNTVTPLIHDGVMFAYGAGDLVYAFNAQNGDLLWQYDRKWSGRTARYSLRAIALYENMVIVPTNDGNVVALDMKTGKVIWDTPLLKATQYRFSGGPLVAGGKILLGTSTGSTTYGHNIVIALDAKSGTELWRQKTVALPGEPGGESWNNIDPDQRTGAGIWTPGSYDPQSGLAFFGTGNNYYNRPLKSLAPGAESNDQLYSNSTLALDVDSGKLVWHFQHLANDLWNYDWAFERTILDLTVKGEKKRLVLTGGKQGIFDGLQVKDGQYQLSRDLGLQNVVTAIDPVTGARTLDPETIPAAGKTRFACPSSHGARNWMPTAYNDRTHVLYIPFMESCMEVKAGFFQQRAFPRPDSDGNFGGVRALDIKTGKTLWTDRRRAVPTTGILATATDLVFAGFLDRMFSAYDAKSGKILWQTRLNDLPSAAPISFMIADKQYIAVITGHGQDSARNIDRAFMAPEILNPSATSPTIWVFAVPD